MPDSEPPADEMMSFDMEDIPELVITDDMREMFAQESTELLEQSEQGLLALLENPENEEVLHSTFRALHSFKGNCGFFGLSIFESLSHEAESVLEAIQESKLKMSSGVLKTLLSVVDRISNGINDFVATGNDQLVIDDLINELSIILKGKKPDSDTVEKLEFPESSSEEQPIKDSPDKQETLEAANADASVTRFPWDVPSEQKSSDTKELDRIVESNESTGAMPVRSMGSIRVDIDKLDQLMNLVGELAIAEGMVTRNTDVNDVEDEALSRAIYQLRRVSSELQEVAMSLRMIPLSGALKRLKRLVHDVSAKAGKQVRLEIIGEETEVDKTVIEKIGDPLVHIVRNSIDHGLEKPEERAALGKKERGEVVISARHEGGEVLITISDDGRGMNRSKILQKGIEKGLVAGDGSSMRDEDVYRLIFNPGFSTAEKVTDISGRGVGMDVVLKNIESLNGRVDIRSSLGQGSTFTLRIPLTMAVIDSMLIRIGKVRYTIPLLMIRESLQPESKQITITPEGQEIIRVRNELIPVVRLHHVFNLESDYQELTEGIIVIVETEGEHVGFFLDEVLGQQETVIKGLSSFFENATCVSGCTVLGDGEVCLILDVADIVRRHL